MTFDVASVRKCLKSFDFSTLFREHLGWDNYQTKRDIAVGTDTIHLTAIAEKKGFHAYICPVIPDRNVRRKVDHQITKIAHEHFIVFYDQLAGQQVWQWVCREPGKPIAPRDHWFDVKTTGDGLIQRLRQIAVSIDEEDNISLPDIASKARAAFDVDKVTKKFYDRFKTEHTAFHKCIKGIKSQADLEWYTSLMLNRLMFVYFIQKKGFLDADVNYLKNRMRLVRDKKGKDKFHSFYRYFLVHLFHDGLGKQERDRKLDRDLETLLGKVPYLNGGFFEVHQIEERNSDIDIPDKAFEQIFAFFDDFSWHLDESPLRTGNEINPDVVGYIFEKYINQKQMGAYYTKEDITEYIGKNTIIPFLFDAAQKKCPIAFKPESYMWRLLRDEPDRYIYSAVRKGVIDNDGNIVPLPKNIEVGISDISQRGGWNKAAPEPYALPTETWREHIARRQRCLEIRTKISSGEICQINDLITLNLDIWQFARDAIANCEGPELLRAFWHAIVGRILDKSNHKYELGLTVLDPTCGSGAFLFAALRILETLYSDCLQGMRSFIEEPVAPPPSSRDQLMGIIARGEHGRCEFKSTMRHCIKTAQAALPDDKRKEVLKAKDKDRNHDVLKSVAAMLNTNGGDVIVGVEDDGTPYGLEADFQYFTKESERNPDGYELWLRQLFINHFGPLNSQKVSTIFEVLQGKQVLWLRINPAESPAFVVNEAKQKVLYIRNGNETRSLEIEQILAYHQTRFSPEAIKELLRLPLVSVAKPAKKNRFEDFRAVLEQIGRHPSERYFILKSIIIHNLFGVDIMEEAVEICKLRLFLKLVAQVESVDQIEPLPDLDFNIRAGNTLVGYVKLDEIRSAQAKTLGFGADEVARIEEDSLSVEKCFEQFRTQQTKHGGKVTVHDKTELRRRLAKLDLELDRYLAGEYGIDAHKEKAFTAWKSSHQPFHWFVEFYGIMRNGGFDVIIGNPPYVEYTKVKRDYTLLPQCGPFATNLYATCISRNAQLKSPSGYTSFIVPVSLPSTDRMQAVRRILLSRHIVHFTSFSTRPSKLFDGAEQRLTIFVQAPCRLGNEILYSGGYLKWSGAERSVLFQLLEFIVVVPVKARNDIWPKLRGPLELAVYNQMSRHSSLGFSGFLIGTEHLYYKNTGLRYFNTVTLKPPKCWINGIATSSSRETILELSKKYVHFVHCYLLSTSFFMFYQAMSNCRDLNPSDISEAPIYQIPKNATVFDRLSKAIEEDYVKKGRIITMNNKLTGEVKLESVTPARSKKLLDEIEQALATHFGFLPEELDYVINYDIKYRMGQDDSDEGEE